MPNNKYDTFKKECANKRQNRNNQNNTSKFGSKTKDITERKEITVQRLSAEVQGKAQKFVRLGPQVFVPYHDNEVSISGIKVACSSYFELPYCDVLVGERGPSARTIEHLTSLNIIFVRFEEDVTVDADDIEQEEDKDKQEELAKSNPPGHLRTETSTKRTGNQFKVPTSMPEPKRPKNENVPIARSLSISEMLNLGKVVKTKLTKISIQHFDIATLAWRDTFDDVEFRLEAKSFGKGNFREAFKARSVIHPIFSGRVWVVKRFINKKDSARGFSLEEECRRTVQCHLLAKNFTDQMKVCLSKDVATSELYGESFSYKDIFLGKIAEEYVTIEEFIPGSFTKYINNTAELPNKKTTVILKAESLMHFTFEKSYRELLLTDLQGVGYSLVDPEIASFELKDSDNKHLYACGNLSFMAHETFVASHKCNIYCEHLGLKAISKDTYLQAEVEEDDEKQDG